MQQYSKDEQTQLADEIEAAPTKAVWPKFINDYGKHRDACRAL